MTEPFRGFRQSARPSKSARVVQSPRSSPVNMLIRP